MQMQTISIEQAESFVESKEWLPLSRKLSERRVS